MGEKKLVYKFSSCKEGKFDVVVVFGGDMVIDNFNFTMDDLMRSERNMQFEWSDDMDNQDGVGGGIRCQTTFKTAELIRTCEQLAMRRILLGGSKPSKPGAG